MLRDEPLSPARRCRRAAAAVLVVRRVLGSTTAE